MSKNEKPRKVLEIRIFETINFFSVRRQEKSFSICEHKKNLFIGGSEFRGFLYSIVLRRMAIQNPAKIPMVFMCESCDYNTSNKKIRKKHTDTLKDKILINPHYNLPNPNKKSPKIPYIFLCELCYYTNLPNEFKVFYL